MLLALLLSPLRGSATAQVCGVGDDDEFLIIKQRRGTREEEKRLMYAVIMIMLCTTCWMTLVVFLGRRHLILFVFILTNFGSFLKSLFQRRGFIIAES